MDPNYPPPYWRFRGRDPVVDTVFEGVAAYALIGLIAVFAPLALMGFLAIVLVALGKA